MTCLHFVISCTIFVNYVNTVCGQRDVCYNISVLCATVEPENKNESRCSFLVTSHRNNKKKSACKDASL